MDVYRLYILSSAVSLLYLSTGGSSVAQSNTFPGTGNAGISTTTPAAKLEIQPSGSDIALRLKNSGPGTNWDLYAYSDGNFYLNNPYGSVFGAAANASANLFFLSGSSVGIGTVTPQAKLHVYDGGTNVSVRAQNSGSFFELQSNSQDGYLNMTGSGSVYFRNGSTAATRLTIDPSGNVGVNTSSPHTKLEVSGGTLAVTASDYSQGYIAVNPGGQSYAGYIDWYKTGHTRLGYMGFQDIAGSQNNLALNLENSANFIIGGGNVGIGTANPTQKLSVNGTVRAKEVIVETTGWSDYVLAKDYKLKALCDEERQIQQEGHLSGIPSAKEVAEHGIPVGDMQAKLLAKVEELTLHLIAQEKAMREIQAENASLKRDMQLFRQSVGMIQR